MNNNKLSADPISLILGIISIVIIFLGCCCGIFAVVSLGLSIVGLVMANKSLREFREAPENYSHQSKSNVTSGKIVSIIGLVLSGLYILFVAACFLIYGKLFTDILKDEYYNKKIIQTTEMDTLGNNYDKTYEADTLSIDTISIDTINKK